MQMEGMTRSNWLILLEILRKNRVATEGGFAEVPDSAQSLLCLDLNVYFRTP
jgi:hypothetical protein